MWGALFASLTAKPMTCPIYHAGESTIEHFRINHGGRSQPLHGPSPPSSLQLFRWRFAMRYTEKSWSISTTSHLLSMFVHLNLRHPPVRGSKSIVDAPWGIKVPPLLLMGRHLVTDELSALIICRKVSIWKSKRYHPKKLMKLEYDGEYIWCCGECKLRCIRTRVVP